MSLLAAARSGLPGPSTSSLLRVPGGVSVMQVRFTSRKPRKNTENAKVGSKRLGVGKPGRPKILKPMNANELKLQIFQPTRRNEKLDLPMFSARAVEEGAEGPMAFPLAKGEPGFVYGLPKPIRREFRILSKPYCIVREITRETCKTLDEASKTSSEETRLVITGDRGSGKSFLLMQAAQYAKEKDWIVIYIPKAKKLVNSTSSYMYDIRTQTYVQPGASFGILKHMLYANSKLLHNIKITSRFAWEKGVINPGQSVAEMIEAVIKENIHAACPVLLERVLAELEGQKTPVLLAVDDFQALYSKTLYKDQHFVTIKPYHLSVPRALLEYASGKRKFPHGAVIGALTTTDTTFPVPLELRDTLDTGYAHPTSPYEKRNESLLSYAKGLKAIKMPQKLSHEEAASMFEVWMMDRVVNVANKDEFFLAKYNEAQGNPRDFVWKGLLNAVEY